MGDAGFLRRLNARVLRHDLIGDTTWSSTRDATPSGPKSVESGTAIAPRLTAPKIAP